MKHTYKVKEDILVKILRFGIYSGVFIPLIIFRDFISPFHFGKVVVFRTLIEILIPFYIVLIFKDKSYLPRRDKLFWGLFSFAAAFSIATAVSAIPYSSFWGSIERMGGLWTFWHYFIFFVIATSVLDKKEHWQRVLDLVIVGGVFSAFYGFGQRTNSDFFLGSGGRERIFGTFGNAALFAGYELFIVFLSLTMFFLYRGLKNQSRQLWYVLAFAVASIAVFMTAVRGSLLAYFVGVLIFSILWMRQRGSIFSRRILWSIVGLAIIFVTLSLLFQESSFIKNSRYLSRITNISFTSPTVQTRFWAWQAGIDGWNDNLKTIIIGWGPENFNVPFSVHFNPKFFVGSGAETLFDRAHNMFIEVLVTMGIIGLLVYSSIFVFLFKYLHELLKDKELKIYGIGLMATIAAYIVHNSFIFDTSGNFVIFFIIFSFISHLNYQKNNDSKHEKINQSPTGSNLAARYLLIVLLIFSGVLIYKTNILPAKANYAVTRAIIKAQTGDFDGSIAKYKEALSYNVHGRYEYRNRLAQYLVSDEAPSVREEKVRDVYRFTISEIDKNIKDRPIDYIPYLYGSRLNILLGKDNPLSPHNDFALNYSSKALKLSPTYVKTYYEIAQAYLNKKNYSSALEAFQKAIELNPDTGISYWYLGVAKLENNDLSGISDLEKALIVYNAYSPEIEDLNRLLNIYIKKDDVVRIANTYEKLIDKKTKNPDPQYFASLAVAYARLGRIDDAVAMARQAVKLDKSFEGDAKIFLRSLGREL